MSVCVPASSTAQRRWLRANARPIALLACLLVLMVAAPANARRKAVKRTRPRADSPRREQPQATASRSTAKRTATPKSPAAPPVEEHLHVRRGDTFDSILAARGVGSDEARRWRAAAAPTFDLRTLGLRHGLTLRFDRETHDLQAVRYEIDEREMLVLEQTDTGISAHRTGLPYVVEVKGVAGRVERGLRDDAAEAGVPPSVIAALADAVAWDVDVESGLQPGDEFRVLYENIWQVGLPRAEPGKLMGATVLSRGEPLTAVYFEDAEGRGAYYLPGGRSLSRSFLRYPLEFTEISSEFSLLRFHPILRRERPHLGVDFAAPRGTPVRAAADGEVVLSARLPELGRCIRIRHPQGIVSVYGHLSRFASGVREGLRVERGQVIGYVGSTGLATGPHLHYALFHEGEYLDPLAMIPAEEEPIPASERARFDRVCEQVVKHLEQLPATSSPRTVAISSVSDRFPTFGSGD